MLRSGLSLEDIRKISKESDISDEGLRPYYYVIAKANADRIKEVLEMGEARLQEVLY